MKKFPSKENANSVFVSELVTALLLAIGLIAVAVLFAESADANPTGGSVVAGSASISGGAGLETITQSSQNSIINWQSFSIGAGETTNFLVPNANSATLNRVTGGNLSQIYGSLNSNGKLILINPNGILFGSSGMINTAGFTASTLNVSNKAFMSNATLHLLGDSKGAVINLGSVTTTGGSVTFIGMTVVNSGSIKAPGGNVNLAASSDVYVTGADMDGVTIRLGDAQGKAIKASDKAAVAAAMQHVKMTGNPFSLAVNTGGAAEATSAFRIGGHTFLGNKGSSFYHKMLAEYGGSAVNTGIITAQNVSIQSQGRNVTNTGTINVVTSASLLAPKGVLASTGTITTAAGGTIETSGLTVDIAGIVDAGQGGKWLIDPTDLTVDSTNVGTYLLSLQDGTAITIQADDSITINAAMSWSTAADLTINSGGSIAINADITAPTGSLVLVAGTTISDTAALNVGTFTLQGGNWVQNSTSLPAFSASNFTIDGGTFLRVLGGDGSSGNPYLLTDVYGLQGVGGFLSSSFALANNIDASGTANWNSGAGFIPIGQNTPYSGDFSSAGYTINGLTINDSTDYYVGLFGQITGDIADVSLIGGSVTSTVSGAYVGGLVAFNDDGIITGSSNTGNVTGADDSAVGGLIGDNGGIISTSYATGAVSGGDSAYVGGLVGYNQGGFGAFFFGGSAGFNGGQIVASYATGSVSGGDYSSDGGLVGAGYDGQIVESYATGAVSGGAGAYVGGLEGYAYGDQIRQTYAAGAVTAGAGSYMGGLVGYNDIGSTITGSYWDTTTAGTIGIGDDATGVAQATGLTAAQMTVASSYIGWDFAAGSLWGLNASINGGLPNFQWQFPIAVVTPPPVTPPPVTPPVQPSQTVGQSSTQTVPQIRIPYENPEWPGLTTPLDNALAVQGPAITWINRPNGPLHFLRPVIVQVAATTTSVDSVVSNVTRAGMQDLKQQPPKGSQNGFKRDFLFGLLVAALGILVWHQGHRLARLVSIVILAACLFLAGCASTNWDSEPTFVHRPGTENEVVVGPGTYHITPKGKVIKDSAKPAKIPWWSAWNGGVIDSDPSNPGKLVGVQ